LLLRCKLSCRNLNYFDAHEHEAFVARFLLATAGGHRSSEPSPGSLVFEVYLRVYYKVFGLYVFDKKILRND
jgi:uncharacterized MAPEG superfamily protein